MFNFIGSIIVEADEGYALSSSKNARQKKGGHGYNNTAATMRAVFMARGPNIKKNVALQPFENVNVYSLLCKLMNIDGQPNNGSFEILKPIYIPYSNDLSSNSNLVVSSFKIIYLIVIFTIFFRFV